MLILTFWLRPHLFKEIYLFIHKIVISLKKRKSALLKKKRKTVSQFFIKPKNKIQRKLVHDTI